MKRKCCAITAKYSCAKLLYACVQSVVNCLPNAQFGNPPSPREGVSLTEMMASRHRQRQQLTWVLDIQTNPINDMF